jgi:hypothetical protein
VWLYGNPQAFRSLAEHMNALASSRASEHHELHVGLQLGSSFAKRKPVFVLMDGAARRVHSRRDFDVTFMVVEAADLKQLRRHQRTGRVPRAWRA